MTARAGDRRACAEAEGEESYVPGGFPGLVGYDMGGDSTFIGEYLRAADDSSAWLRNCEEARL